MSTLKTSAGLTTVQSARPGVGVGSNVSPVASALTGSAGIRTNRIRQLSLLTFVQAWIVPLKEKSVPTTGEAPQESERFGFDDEDKDLSPPT